MKVLIVFSSNGIGGAEKSITRMSYYTNNNLNTNYVLATIGGEGDWSEWVNSLKAKYFTTLPGKSNFIDVIKITNYIRRHQFDVVYVIGLRLSIMIRFIKLIFNMKFVLVHGIRWVPSGQTKLDITTRFTEKIFNRLIDGYIVNSKESEKVLIETCRISQKKVFTIYNGIEKTSENKKTRNIKRILTIANLSPRKGYVEYLSVIKEVILRHPDVKFVFVGIDNMNGKVLDLIKKNNLSDYIEYLGFVKNVQDELKKSYIFVLPSLHSEGCPTSIMEAMSYSIPCIAYNICGINEIIVNKKTGLLAKVNDQEMLAQNICELIENKVLYREMSIASEKRIKNYFTLESCSKSHLKTFSELYNKIN